MVKKLTKTGNSYALIIDKTMMELLHANEDDCFNISFNNGSMVVTPANIGVDREELEATARMIFKRNAKTFKKLAE